MEKELFITVANYSLPENAEEYLDCLKNTPEKPARCYNYAKWLYRAFVFKAGLAKFPPDSAWKTLYELKAITGEEDRFTDAELNGFEQRRKRLIDVLDQIVSDKPLPEIDGLGGLLLIAGELTRDDQYNFGDKGITRGEMPLYPWTPKEKRRSTIAAVKPEKSGRVLLVYDVLIPVFNLACYRLSTLLGDGGGCRIKKCPLCEKFFIAKDVKRKRCYGADCKKIYEREKKRRQRKDEPDIYC
ncbi:hypothetical protein C4565_04900 [Candidatus Parcubacteria bacterium]|nr:MAG: hypothetical protein C4565_04900 [Candidatus Parcubacteria bacterium]